MKMKALLACGCGLVLLAGCGSSAPQAKLTPQTITEKDFAKLDLNKDGTISYDEFDLATDNKGDLTGNAVYIQIDKDGNGLISQEEFKTPVAPAAAPAATAPAAEKPAAEPAKKEEKKAAPAKDAPKADDKSKDAKK